jgi:hypothetical protein
MVPITLFAQAETPLAVPLNQELKVSQVVLAQALIFVIALLPKA